MKTCKSSRNTASPKRIQRQNTSFTRPKGTGFKSVKTKKESEIIRGKADALTTKIFADAFGRDPEFYAFTRSLIAYEQSMTGANTTMVISPDSEFFDYIKESGKD